MNKIELIKKSIEDKTGEPIHVSQHLGTFYFSHMDKAISYGKINESFLQYLPISDPLEEQPDKGWIPVIEELKSLLDTSQMFSDSSAKCSLYRHIQRRITELSKAKAPLK